MLIKRAVANKSIGTVILPFAAIFFISNSVLTKYFKIVLRHAVLD
jgi:hypothetical protein